MKLIDPDCGFSFLWKNIFLLCSVLGLFLDPLFLYVPVVNETQNCLDMDRNLAIVLCVLRTLADILYVLNIIIQFRTPYKARYDMHGIRITTKPSYVAKCYLTSNFIIDVLAALPLPQLAVLIIIPNLDGPTSFSKEKFLKFVISQYVTRVISTRLFYQKMTNISGFLIEKAWAGAAFNFLLYVLASYVLGALWYLFAIESALRCWHIACKRHSCHSEYLYCWKGRVGDYRFLNASCALLERNGIKDSPNFDFGIFLDALQKGVLETRDFRQKVLYCSWWGLQNLSSVGQGLKASTFYGETLFAYFIVVIGVVSYVLLLGNMQKYIQSPSNLSRRREEMKEKVRETEVGMSDMVLPEELRKRVRREMQHAWKLKHNVESESFIRDLSPDLRKDINRYRFFPLLKKVPAFKQMDEHLLDAICDHLKPACYIENSYLMQEGDPAHIMLFKTCGKVADDGTIGDFYGEELLKWVLDPKRQQRPFTTRTVKALADVQGYALVADELLDVVSQFRLSYNRFYSQQWRARAACNIQFAWRRHCTRLQDRALATGSETSTNSIGVSIYVSRFYSVLKSILKRKRRSQRYNGQVSPPKPEPLLQRQLSLILMML